MTKEIFMVIGTILGSSVMGLAVYLLQEYRKGKAANTPMVKTLEYISQVYQCMHVLLTGNVEKVLILKTENGGGVPKLGGQLFLSTVMEEYKAPFKASVGDIKLKIDAHYVGQLIDLQKVDYISVDTIALPDGLMKNLLENEGAVAAEIHFLHQTPLAYYHILIMTSSGKPLSKDRMKIGGYTGKIQEIFKKAYG